MKLSKHYLLAVALLSLCGAGCTNTFYQDAQDRESFDADYGRSDLQAFANDSVEKLQNSARLASYKPDPAQPIKIYLGGIQNRTNEHIDTSGIRDKMSVALVNAEQRRFTVLADPGGQAEIGDRLRFQEESGRVDPNEAREIGRQLGAEIVIYGSLRDIEKKRGRSIEALGSKTRDVYFQFTLSAVDIETAEILWANEVELSKKERVSFFGGAG